jgi:hypothetical protein
MVFFSGLLNGKTGISLFFFHYGRYTGHSLYNEYARYLIELVKSQIHDDYPLDYERGLAGVGAGLDYLQKNGFYDAGDDFMDMVDSRIIKAAGYDSRAEMLTGFARYLLARADSSRTVSNFLSLEKNKIQSYPPESTHLKIQDALKTLAHKKPSQFSEISDLQWLLQCEQLLKETENETFMPNIKRAILKIISSFNLSKLDDLFSENRNFAFQGGYAGLGLALLALLEPELISWTKLL